MTHVYTCGTFIVRLWKWLLKDLPMTSFSYLLVIEIHVTFVTLQIPEMVIITNLPMGVYRNEGSERTSFYEILTGNLLLL